MLCEPVHHFFRVRSVRGSRRLVTFTPAGNLPFYVTIRLSEIVEADFFVIDSVKFVLYPQNFLI